MSRPPRPAPSRRPAPAPRPRPARPAPARPVDLGDPGRRLGGGLLVVVLLLAAVAVRLVWLQGVQAPAYAEDARDQRLRTAVLPATRGRVLDRDGEPLALSVDARAVYGEPRTIAKATCPPDAEKPCDPASIAAALAPLLDLPAAELQERLERKTAFVYLARGVEVRVAQAVRELRLVGIGTLKEPRRVHPAGELAASVVGFTNTEGKGAAGVEHGWDEALAGTPGKATAEVDGEGRELPTESREVVPPVPGSDVRLTIDRDLQWFAQDVLARKVAEVQAENGTVVVMDPRTGEVLALATAPSFDPENRKGLPAKRFGNPAISDPYEPGSVNKVITAAAALEAGVATPDTELVVPWTYQVAGRTFHDSHPHPVQHLTFTGVMVTSSNVGTIKVAEKLGKNRMYEAMRRFGFGEKTGLGLPGESRGIVPKPKDWSGTSIATIPIGQGVSATAVQVASVYATLANGGVRVTPRIVDAVVRPDGTEEQVGREAPRRVVSAAVADQLRKMLEGVVTAEGTAPLAAVPGYRVAGKTGTAQRVVDGRYQAGNYTSSFIGFAPADAPRLVVAVVLQGTGKKAYYGGAVAGPVFKDVMSFGLRSLRVPPTQTTPPVLRLTAGAAPRR